MSPSAGRMCEPQLDLGGFAARGIPCVAPASQPEAYSRNVVLPLGSMYSPRWTERFISSS